MENKKDPSKRLDEAFAEIRTSLRFLVKSAEYQNAVLEDLCNKNRKNDTNNCRKQSQQGND